MKKLGGSMFVHNALSYDYCVKEAIESLCAVCDEVVVIDVESEDSTYNLLQSLSYENLRVEQVGKWDCAPDYHRLAILANEAKSKLNTEWHLMLQADEVIHENSFPAIRRAINGDEDAYMCKRVNIYGNFDSYIWEGSLRLPCSCRVLRLGKIYLDATGDAESLGRPPNKEVSYDFYEDIIIFHYGYVRMHNAQMKKVLDMQSWFGFGVDERFKKWNAEGKKFQPYDIIPKEALKKIEYTHPVFAKEWVKERKGLFD